MDYVKDGTCFPITNPMNCLFTDFDNETITIGFEQGQDAAEQFYRTYLQNRLANKVSIIPESNLDKLETETNQKAEEDIKDLVEDLIQNVEQKL